MLRYLVRLRPKFGTSAELLTAAKAVGRSVGAEVRAPKTTSYGALEVDVFVPGAPDLQLFLAAVEPLSDVEFVHDLNLAAPHQTKEGAVLEAVALFDQERYWEAHEVLEGIWRTSSGKEKLLLQGMILVCAALVHWQKGECGVALGVMRRAAVQLDWPEGTYLGVDVDALSARVRDAIESGELRPLRI